MSTLYHRPSDRLTGTWSLSTGTARSGYGPTNVGDGDPSVPCWVTGTSIRLVCDLGSAQQIDQVYIFGHNFVNSANVHAQAHTSSTWGSPDCDVALTVPTAYADGFAVSLRADFKTAYLSAGNRTKRYVSIANLSANAVTCAVGEVWIATTTRVFVCGTPKWGFMDGRQRITSSLASKRGVVTVYDYGSFDGSLDLEFPFTDADAEDARDLELDAYGPGRSFPITIDTGNAKTRFAEPRLVRFGGTLTTTPYTFATCIPTKMPLSELGRGSVLGA